MLALWLSTWLCPMPLTQSQTSYPWHLWALGLCLGSLASLNMWFQALTSWIGQIRMSGCYFWLPHICSSNCTGFAIWTPIATKDITILFLSCFWTEAQESSENKDIMVCFFCRQQLDTCYMITPNLKSGLLSTLKSVMTSAAFWIKFKSLGRREHPWTLCLPV